MPSIGDALPYVRGLRQIPSHVGAITVADIVQNDIRMGGYEPSRIVVQAGQRVKLNFLRRDPSSCLEEVRLPDFHIAQNLPLNKATTVEFTPTQPGSYEFACGMNMFRGMIEVETSNAPSKEKPFSQASA